MYKKLVIIALILGNLSAIAQKKSTPKNSPLQNATRELAYLLTYSPQNVKAPIISLIMRRTGCGIADAAVYLETINTNLNSRSIVFQAFYDFTQGDRNYLFLNLQNIGLTALNSRLITDYIISNYSPRDDQQPSKSEKEITDDSKKKKSELINQYKQITDALIHGNEPLKQYGIQLDNDNEKYGLPTKLEYNEAEIGYIIDKQLLVNLLDSLNVSDNFFLRFDKFGKFKSLLDKDHNLIHLNEEIVSGFQRSISLQAPAILHYNNKDYNVDFETKEFTLYKNQGYFYKQFAFSPSKKAIEFLDKSNITAILDKDPKFHSNDGSPEQITLANSPKNINFLKQLLYPNLAKIDYDREFGYSNMVLGAQISFYRFHFKIKNDMLDCTSPGTLYIVNTKSIGKAIYLLKNSAGNKEQIAIKIKVENGSEVLDKVYVYNWVRKEIEQLHL